MGMVMPMISVITPTNSKDWFMKARKSLERQTHQDWEWIVLTNGGFVPDFDEPDPRIRLVASRTNLPFVGAMKKEACSYAASPFIVEFDHDDELSSDCLEEVLKAFNETGATFVYSNDATVNQDGAARQPYRADYGWKMEKATFKGEKDEEFLIHRRPILIAQNVAKIHFAPNHVRAWRKDAYEAVGGHNPSFKICDDLDLMQRLWVHSAGNFRHIDKCLYKYVVHGKNTWLLHSTEIQKENERMYEEKIEQMAFSAYPKGRVYIGPPNQNADGWIRFNILHASVLEEAGGHWPFGDNTLGVIKSEGGIEQLRLPIHTMNEAYRCLHHGGLFLIDVPLAVGDGGHSSPANRSFWNSDTFQHYTNKGRQAYVKHLGVDCRFQEVFKRTYHQYGAPFLRIHLAALKAGPRLHGPIEI